MREVVTDVFGWGEGDLDFAEMTARSLGDYRVWLRWVQVGSSGWNQLSPQRKNRGRPPFLKFLLCFLNGRERHRWVAVSAREGKLFNRRIQPKDECEKNTIDSGWNYFQPKPWERIGSSAARHTGQNGSGHTT
jgi:hypothetical protein